MNSKLKQSINEKTISLEEFSRDFTLEQNKIVEDELRYYTVVAELRRLRKESGLTQAELAKRAEVPRTTITKIESGTYNPTLSTLMTIASALNKKVQVLFV